MPRRPVSGLADEATRLIKAHPMASVGAIAGGLLVAAAIARRTAPAPAPSDQAAPPDSRTLGPDSGLFPAAAPALAPSPLAPAPSAAEAPPAPAIDLSGLISAITGAAGSGQQAGVDLGGQGLAAGVQLGGAGLQAGVDLGSAGLEAGTQLGLGGLGLAATSVDVLGSSLQTSVNAQAAQTLGVTDTLGGVIGKFTDIFAGKSAPWWAPKPSTTPAPKPAAKPAPKPKPQIVLMPARPKTIISSKAGSKTVARSAPSSGNPRIQPVKKPAPKPSPGRFRYL